MENNEELEGALPSEEAEELEGEENTVEGEETPPSDQNELDFEERLAEEKRKIEERLGNKVDKERQKRIEAQKNTMSREEVDRLINEKVGEVQKTMFKERAEVIAERMSKSAAEKDLTLLFYETRIIPTGNIQEDMESAHALATRRTTQNTISELQTSLKSKKTVSSGGSDAGAPVERKAQPKYSQDVIEGAKFAGVTPEEFIKKQT